MAAASRELSKFVRASMPRSVLWYDGSILEKVFGKCFDEYDLDIVLEMASDMLHSISLSRCRGWHLGSRRRTLTGSDDYGDEVLGRHR